ncbi:MAG: hypothetical protein MPJ78_10050 [Hyphomicrobiaceae bacterium]|nr:hypothetical protein [Hyphomicrobiaceae bacterium]
MDVRSTNRTIKTDYAARKRPAEVESTSRALTVQGAPSVEKVSRAASSTNPNRRASAFLAHLTLQYDDKTAQNRRIVERRACAISAYETTHPTNTASGSRAKRGVKI